MQCDAPPVRSDPRAAHLVRPWGHTGVRPREMGARGYSAEGTWPKAAKLSLLSFCTLSVRPALPVDCASARARTARPLSHVARLQPNGAARILRSMCEDLPGVQGTRSAPQCGRARMTVRRG